jgi:hypothetical protein
VEVIQRVQGKDCDTNELISIVRTFIQVADDLYKQNKINQAQYIELTYLKKDFLQQFDQEINIS